MTLSGLRPVFGERLLEGEADLLAYAYDGSLARGRPTAAALARTAEEVRRAVVWCAAEGVPYVARGAGTNLCGSCVPARGGLVLSTAPMKALLSVDTEARVAQAEPGLVNARLQGALKPLGFFYAPDPASYRVCTLGGNAGENAGGPRCLKYGVTTHHVRALEAVMPDGGVARFAREDEGPELLSLLVGAEGTLGVITRLWLDITPQPEAIHTLLAAFPTLESSLECVSALIAAGVLPRVLEAMDRLSVESIEAHHPCGLPKAEAVLLIEVEGSSAPALEQLGRVRALCRRHGCLELRGAASEAERERLWEGRRSAYAALARLAPNVMVEDGVVPRSRLGSALGRVRAACAEERISAGLLFHAGDGNLHPNMIFDERDAGQSVRVRRAGQAILSACVELGGSLSGEHGIGLDKRAAMAGLFEPPALELFRRIKRAFDPNDLANPDKVIPLPGEVPPSPLPVRTRSPLSDAASALAASVRALAASHREIRLFGAGTQGAFARPGDLRTSGLGAILELDLADYALRAEAGARVSELREAVRAGGAWAPLPDYPGTLGGFLATRPWSEIRRHILGVRVLLPTGAVAEFGGKTVKDVAGYDIPKLLLGSWGTLAVILDATLRVYASPLELPASLPSMRPYRPGPWQRKLKEAFDPEGLLNAWVFRENRL